MVSGDTLREAVARAIYLGLYAKQGGDWSAVDPRHQQQVWGGIADAALLAIVHAAGLDAEGLRDQAEELAAEAERERLLNLGDHALLGRVAALLLALASAAQPPEAAAQ